MSKKQNAYVSIKETEKEGRKYKNICVSVTLNNGDVFNFQCVAKFLNSKSYAKLINNLPYESK